MDPRTPAIFTHRLLRSEDWRVLAADADEPLYTLRQGHALSQGVELSPLADQALRVLVCPTVARIQALRTALRHAASPDLQVDGGPYGELGLLMLATHVEIVSNKQSYVLSARQDLAKRLEHHGLTLAQAWDAAWISLREHKRHPWPSGAGKGTHLSFDRAWANWALNPKSSNPWIFPAPPLVDQRRMVTLHMKEGELGNWINENGWRLRWLVAHLDPIEVAQRLPDQVYAAVEQRTQAEAAARSSGRSAVPSSNLADDGLAESLTALQRKLGQPVDLDWSKPGMGRWLPHCLALRRDREASDRLRSSSLPRPRSRP